MLPWREGAYHLAAAFFVEPIGEDDGSCRAEPTFDEEFDGGPARDDQRLVWGEEMERT
jgi:hypothetical protein